MTSHLIDEFMAAAQAALLDGPRFTVTEEQLPDGGLALKFRGAEPPHADGGTLIIPAGTVFANYKSEPVDGTTTPPPPAPPTP